MSLLVIDKIQFSNQINEDMNINLAHWLNYSWTTRKAERAFCFRDNL